MAGKKKTIEQWIKQARAIHGGKYDYSKVVYNGCSEDVTIICPIHGEFKQRASSHIQGYGCRKCGNENKPHPKRYTTEKWIAAAKKVHGDKYDYSKVEYISPFEEVTIICPIHGEFHQKPTYHLSGNGCKKCGYEKVSDSLSNSAEEFIKKAKEVHGDKYDYSKVEYISNKKEVIVICPKHGEFKVRPDNHLHNKNGCPYCSTSKLEESIHKILEKNDVEYIIEKEFEWLRNDITNYQMRYDVFIPSKKIAIECQGQQHIVSSGRFNDELVGQIKHRDKIKFKLSKENGIRLYYLIDKEFYERALEMDLYNKDNLFYDINELFEKING